MGSWGAEEEEHVFRLRAALSAAYVSRPSASESTTFCNSRPSVGSLTSLHRRPDAILMKLLWDKDRREVISEVSS